MENYYEIRNYFYDVGLLMYYIRKVLEDEEKRKKGKKGEEKKEPKFPEQAWDALNRVSVKKTQEVFSWIETRAALSQDEVFCGILNDLLLVNSSILVEADVFIRDHTQKPEGGSYSLKGGFVEGGFLWFAEPRIFHFLMSLRWSLFALSHTHEYKLELGKKLRSLYNHEGKDIIKFLGDSKPAPPEPEPEIRRGNKRGKPLFTEPQLIYQVMALAELDIKELRQGSGYTFLQSFDAARLARYLSLFGGTKAAYAQRISELSMSEYNDKLEEVKEDLLEMFKYTPKD